MAKYDGWPGGINNLAPDVALPTDQYGNVVTLRDAVNVDVLDKGLLRQRPGISQVFDSTNSHSLFANDTFMVWATDSELIICDTSMFARSILTDTRLAEPISFVDVNGDIYFTNTQINGIIRRDGTYERWGIDAPSVAPLPLTPQAGPYRYYVSCTFVTDRGEESGAPMGRLVSTAENPSIQLFDIPVSTDSRVSTVRIYLTNIDGMEMQQVIDLPNGATSWALQGFFSYGMALKTQFMEPPPKGQLLEFHDGIIYIASGSVVYHTQPLRFNLYDPSTDYLMYAHRVTLLGSVSGGLYIGADSLRFISNTGTEDISQDTALPIKAVEGAKTSVPDSTDFIFMSDRGFARAKSGGQVDLLTEKNIAVDSYSRGAMGYTSVGGHKAVVAVFANPTANENVAEDFVNDVNNRKSLERDLA